jgi:hypothetical protein
MSTRREQRETPVGGDKNLGSNRNAEGSREVTNRERVGHTVVEAHGVSDPDGTKDQYTRKHEQGAFESKGESGKRQVKTSKKRDPWPLCRLKSPAPRSRLIVRRK